MRDMKPMGNENSDAGHMKCSRGTQAPHPEFIPLLLFNT